MKKTEKPWMPEELALLRDNYLTLGYEAIAKQLGRTSASVRGKASKLGISRRKGKAKVCWSSGPDKKRCPHCGKAVRHG
jgi:predicted ATPase